MPSLNDSNLVDEDTLLIVEASKETTFDDVEALGYSIIKEKLYKTNKHVFLENNEEERDMLRAIYPGSFDPVTIRTSGYHHKSQRDLWTN